MKKCHPWILGLALLALAFVSGCTTDPRTDPNAKYVGGFRGPGASTGPAFDNVSYWDGDGMSGAPSIDVNIGEQRAYFYKGGELAGVSLISSGREGLGTVTGHFKVIQKDRDHKSSLFGDYVDASGQIVKGNIDRNKDPMPPGSHFDGAKMPFFMRIVGGTGMHQGFLPGYPASHGCIRMPGFMAEAFFRSVSVGTPVTVSM